MAQDNWTIRGFDGTEQLFEEALPGLSVADVRALLMCLVSCKLTHEEVVSSFSGRAKHLEVRPNGSGFMTPSTGYHFTADRAGE